jgi:hypothetical protein
MSDRSLDRTREQARRGKTSGPKRARREQSRAVIDSDGNHVGVIHGHHLTADDVEAARLLIRWMPDYSNVVTS